VIISRHFSQGTDKSQRKASASAVGVLAKIGTRYVPPKHKLEALLLDKTRSVV